MFIYSALNIYLFSTYIISKSPLKIKSVFLFYVGFFLLFLVSAFRFNVGVDYDSYYRIFQSIGASGYDWAQEPFTNLFSLISSYLDIDYWFVFSLFSFLTLFNVSQFLIYFKKYREFLALFFLLVGIYYLSSLNAVTQWLAISFFLMAVIRFDQKRYFTGLIFIAFAGLSHFSAIILFFVYLSFFIKFTLSRFIAFLLISLIFGNLFIELIGFTPYSVYIDLIKFEKNVSAVYFFLYLLPLIFFVIYFEFLYVQQFTARDLLLKLNFFSIYFFVLGFYLNFDFLTINRVVMYFQPSFMVLAVIFLSSMKKDSRLIFTLFLLLLLEANFIYTIAINGEYYKLLPYNFIF